MSRGGAQAMWPSGGVAPNEPTVLEFVQPPLHRPPPPPPVKDRCVTQDVVEVFDRRVRDGMVLMERVRAAHPAHRYAAGGGALREIGVLAAISAIELAASADVLPGRGAHRERQRPEHSVVGAGDDVVMWWCGTVWVRVHLT